MSTKRSYLSKVVVEMPDSGIKDFFDIANTMDASDKRGAFRDSHNRCAS